MNVPQNAILIHSGSNASVPSGYTRETTLDAKYPKGTAAATNPNVTGGATTHSHAALADHAHTLLNHTHNITLGDFTATSTADTSGSGNLADHHTHATFTSGAVVGGGLSSVAATYGSVSNDPPYMAAIFVKSDGTKKVPNNGIALFSSSSIPSNWKFCNGTSSTPDYRNKYLKGAAGGADAGATGGSTTNLHELTHTHTVLAHSHAAATSGGMIGATNRNNTGTSEARNDHTHVVTLTDTTDTIAAGNPTLTTLESVEPAYTKLLAIQNQTGSESLPRGVIALWLGTLASIPSGWVLCDGTNGTVDMRGRYLKIASATSEIGTTGGSNTHAHASQTHTHAASGTHTHGPTSVNHSPAFTRSTSGGNKSTSVNNTHPVTVSAGTSIYADALTAANSQSNEPEYRTVAYIMYTGTGFEKHVSMVTTPRVSTSTSYTISTDRQVNWLYDADVYDNVDAIYLEADLKVDSSANTGYVSLYTAAGAAVASSEVTTTSTSIAKVRSGDIKGSLVDGTTYHIRYKTSAGTVSVNAARMIIIQQGPITKTETVIELAEQLNCSATYSFPTSYGIWKYEAARWTGTVTIYIEADLKCSNAARTTYAELWDLTAGAAVAGVEVSHTGDTTNTRTRSSDIKSSLVDGHEYTFKVKGDSGSLEDVSACKIVVIQSGSITKTDCYMAVLNSASSGTNTSYQNQDRDIRFDASNWFATSISWHLESTLRISDAFDTSYVGRAFLIAQVDF